MERLELEDYLLVAEAVLGGDFDLYPEPATMAAILCSRIVKNHALPDGNKRTGLLCMLEFVERNGLPWKSPDQDELAHTIDQLAAGALSEPDFATWVAQFIS